MSILRVHRMRITYGFIWKWFSYKVSYVNVENLNLISTNKIKRKKNK